MHLIENYIIFAGDEDMFIVQLSHKKTVWERMLRPFLDDAMLMEIAGTIPDRYDNLQIVSFDTVQNGIIVKKYLKYPQVVNK